MLTFSPTQSVPELLPQSMTVRFPEDVKHRRSAALIAECQRVRDEILSDVVAEGKPLSVILETAKGRVYQGHSDSYIEVVTESDTDLRGRLVSVMPTHYENGKIYGKII